MDRKISLSWFLSLSFLGIALLPVVGYAFLSLSFFGKGLGSIISANLAQAVQLYAADTPAAGRRGLQNVNGLEIAPRWEDMPAEVRDNLTPPLREGVLYKYDLGSWPDPPQQLNFVMRVRADGQDYYVRQGVRQEDASPLVGRQMAETVRILLGVSAVTVAALFLFTRLLIRKVSRPAKALADWAAELDEQRLKETPPDFCYPELNKLAALIRKSLVAEHRNLERERLFLQYSSHELRTPISVVLAATELLRKIMSRRGTDREMEKSIVQRIDRAGHTMTHLVETLLWLGRDVAEMPAPGMVDIDALLKEIVHDTNKLYIEKDLKFVLETAPCRMLLPEAAARIVLGNVVRNAFQHTLRGIIHISQHGGVVEVVNYMARESDLAGDIGFGLGLELTRRLTARLDWLYTSQAFPGRNVVTVRLSETVALPC